MFLGEGDAFTYLDLLDNGLRAYDDATPGQTLLLVLEATDGGRPALARHRRVVVTVVR